MNDTDLCKDTNHINELSIIVSNDFTRLDKTEFYTQLNELLFSEQWFHGHHVGGRWSEVWNNGKEKLMAQATRKKKPLLLSGSDSRSPLLRTQRGGWWDQTPRLVQMMLVGPSGV